MATFHIIFPAGDRSRLEVLELDYALKYELDDYALASRQEFHDRETAEEYAKSLARSHGKSFIEERNGREQSFLD